MWKFNQKSAT